MSQSTTHESDRPSPAAGLRLGRFVFKPASTPDEFEQLHRLNHATFVREVPQHADRGDGRLVDKFHDRNLYFIALDGTCVVGMLAVHDRAPFSIADKLADVSLLARLGPRPLEVRLLAIEPGHRHGAVFAGLGLAVLRHAQRQRYSHLLISGVAERLGMYERLGFRALGPPSQHGAASFVPMVAPVAELPASVLDDLRRIEAKTRAARELRADLPAAIEAAMEVAATHAAAPSAGSPPRAMLSLTPGHSQLSPAVLAALAQPGIDHRSEEFAALHALVLARLAALTGGLAPALFCGSGTLANDVVAATLAADRRTRRGLVLVNGEFGRRLSAQAARFGLRHDTLAFDWGTPWDRAALERALDGRGDCDRRDSHGAHLSQDAPDWVWAVHLESSTGMLNDVAMLRDAAARRGVRVCLDCISSLGAVPLDLSGVHLGTGFTRV